MAAPVEPPMRPASAVSHPAPTPLSIRRMGFAVAISILET